jgi:voltage-gated potassium channel
MRSLRLSFGALFVAFLEVARNPRTRALPWMALAVLVFGTVFYWREEHWTLIQALYFSVATVTTVGYGDLHPTTELGRLVTAFYILVGVGTLLALITAVIQSYVRSQR